MYRYIIKKVPAITGQLLLWLKRKIILIIAAFMLGMGNVIEGTDHSVLGNQDKTEQEDRKG